MKIVERLVLGLTMGSRTEGPLKLDCGLLRLFLSLPEDPLPGFIGPTTKLRGRGKDHPRYGRFMQAFTIYHKPDIVLEIGTNAGGTAVGIAGGLVRNGKGKLICVDSGEGRPRSFPDLAEKNICSCGLDPDRLELICEDSTTALPRLSSTLKGRVDICLVDAAHTYQAAASDIEIVLPMIRRGGFVLVHDISKSIDLGEEKSHNHPYPVYQAFHELARKYDLNWCVLKFIRKHLGVMHVR